jgi:hypothetical protein
MQDNTTDSKIAWPAVTRSSKGSKDILIDHIISCIKANNHIMNEAKYKSIYKEFLHQEIFTALPIGTSSNAQRMKHALERNIKDTDQLTLHLPLQLPEEDKCYLFAQTTNGGDKVSILTFYFSGSVIMSILPMGNLREANNKLCTAEMEMLGYLADNIVQQHNVYRKDLLEQTVSNNYPSSESVMIKLFEEFVSTRMNASVHGCTEAYNGQIFCDAMNSVLNSFLFPVKPKIYVQLEKNSDKLVLPPNHNKDEKQYYYRIYKLVKRGSGGHGSMPKFIKGFIFKTSGTILEFCDLVTKVPNTTPTITPATKEQTEFYKTVSELTELLQHLMIDSEKLLNNALKSYLEILFDVGAWDVKFNTLLNKIVDVITATKQPNAKSDILERCRVFTFSPKTQQQHSDPNYQLLKNYYTKYCHNIEAIKKINNCILDKSTHFNDTLLHEIKIMLLKISNNGPNSL